MTRIVQYLLPNLEKEITNLEDALAGYHTNLETWFNNAMVQATKVYKNNSARIAFIIGLILSILFNVDTINIAEKLWQDPTVRGILVAQAENQTNANLFPPDIMIQARELNFPIGWTTTQSQQASCSFIGTANYQVVARTGDECRVLTSLPPLNNFFGLLVHRKESS